MTPRERALVVAVVGEADEPLLRALRDARGRTFERLEFLGDSVLDVVMAAHSVLEPDCGECPRPAPGRAGSPTTQRFVTDQRLASRAQDFGLGAWLEWEAGADRRADLVEACVATAWLAGGWGRAVAVVQQVVHPVGDATAAVLEHGAMPTEPTEPTEPSPPGRAVRRLGAALLELAAAQLVYTADPEADEGVLSQRRATMHRAAVVAAHAREGHLVDGRGPDAAVSDRVEQVLAGQLLGGGAEVALAAARRVLVAPRRRD